MLRFFLLFLLGFILQFPALSQASKIDSLTLVLENAQHDSIRYTIYIKLSEQLESSNYDSAIQYSLLANEIASKNNWITKKGKALVRIGIVHQQNSNSDSATYYIDKAILLFKKNKDVEEEFASLYHLGNAYSALEENKKSIATYQTALELKDQVKNTRLLGKVYNNIGVIYQYTGAFEKALNYHLKAQKIRIANDDKKGIAGSHDNLGLAYFDLGEIEKALEHYNAALEIYKEQKDSLEVLQRTYSIGGALYSKGEYDKAMIYLNEALALSEKTNRLSISINCYQVIGLIHIKKKEYKEAEKLMSLAQARFPAKGPKRMLIYVKSNLAVLYLNWGTDVKQNRVEHLKKAIELSKETQKLSVETAFLVMSKKSVEVLYKAYQELGQYEQSIQYARNYIELNDSLLTEQKQNAILDVEAKYEAEKKDLEIDILNKDKELKEVSLLNSKTAQKRQRFIIYVLSGGALLIAVFGLIIFRFYRQKRKVNDQLSEQYGTILRQKEEKEILLKEIHHRVKNNLQVISSLLDLQSDNISDKAALSAVEDGQSRVKAMALIHQNLYQNENVGSISFKDYSSQLIKQVASVYSIGNKVEIELKMDTTFFDIDTAIPVGLILNELVSNAYKYAFKSEEKGKLSIQLEEISEGEYCLLINDNGEGLPSNFEVSKAKSLGLRLVHRLSRQLYGKVEYVYEQGANFKVTFKDTEQRKLVQ